MRYLYFLKTLLAIAVCILTFNYFNLSNALILLSFAITFIIDAFIEPYNVKLKIVFSILLAGFTAVGFFISKLTALFTIILLAVYAIYYYIKASPYWFGFKNENYRNYTILSLFIIISATLTLSYAVTTAFSFLYAVELPLKIISVLYAISTTFEYFLVLNENNAIR